MKGLQIFNNLYIYYGQVLLYINTHQNKGGILCKSLAF